MTAFHDLVSSVDPPMYVVTARAEDGEPVGCLVGFATQCSIEPPRFLVCISKANHTYRPAMAASHLVVHVLRAGDGAIAERFGGTTADDLAGGGREKFEGLGTSDGPGGAPVIDDLDHFAGRVVERVDCGDHVAVVLDPSGGSAEHAAEPQYGLRAASEIEPGHPDD